jgi:hypothetical protein
MRCRWDGDIELDFSDEGCEGFEKTELAQDIFQRWASVNTWVNLGVQYK